MIWTTVPKLPWQEADKGCDRCGAKGHLTFYDGFWLCDVCIKPVCG